MRTKATRAGTTKVRTIKLTVLLALLLLGFFSVGAQERATPAESPEDFSKTTFTDIIDVRVVEVEVVVTDKGGHRVGGLGPDEFHLLVDGEPTPVEYFSEVREDALVTSPGDAAGAEVSGENDVEPAVWEDPGRSYLVFLDDYFTDRRYRHRLLKNLDKSVETLRPVDRMAVVRFEGYGLEVLTDWTSSKDELREALDEARKRTPRELIRQTLAGVSANPVTRSQILARQIDEVAGAMAVAMRSFANVPGRKLLLPVTEGWPFDPTLDLSGPGVTAEETRNLQPTSDRVNDLPGDVTEERGARTRPLAGSLNPNPNEGQLGTLPTLGELIELRNLDLLSPMIDHANLLGYTIYPMGLGTLEIGGGGELERSSLWILARETGGRIATEGAAATLPLDPVVEDTGSYYVLGFSPERAWDDQRHRVEVKLLRDGLKARHRRNFLDLSHAARQEMEAEEALLRGEGGDLDVTVGKWRGRQVPVTLRIPMDWVTMVPEGDHYSCELELRVATVDERGGRSEISTVPIRIEGPEPPPGSHAIYDTRLQLRKIQQRVVLYLYDTLSGESKVAGLELSP